MKVVLRMMLLTPLLAACYKNVPVRTDVNPPSDSRVLLELTDRGTADLAERIGAGVGQVEGRVVTWSPDTIVLRLNRTILRGGAATTWGGELLAVPRVLVSVAHERHIDRPRTVLAVGGVIVAIGSVVLGAELIGGGTTERPGGGGPPGGGNLRLP